MKIAVLVSSFIFLATISGAFASCSLYLEDAEEKLNKSLLPTISKELTKKGYTLVDNQNADYYMSVSLLHVLYTNDECKQEVSVRIKKNSGELVSEIQRPEGLFSFLLAKNPFDAAVRLSKNVVISSIKNLPRCKN